MKKLSVGIIGLGNRGYGLLKDAILRMPSVKVTAVCDVYEDRCEEAARLTEELCGHIPARSEEHTSELQSIIDIVCRLLLEKKKNTRAQRGCCICNWEALV